MSIRKTALLFLMLISLRANAAVQIALHNVGTVTLSSYGVYSAASGGTLIAGGWASVGPGATSLCSSSPDFSGWPPNVYIQYASCGTRGVVPVNLGSGCQTYDVDPVGCTFVTNNAGPAIYCEDQTYTNSTPFNVIFVAKTTGLSGSTNCGFQGNFTAGVGVTFSTLLNAGSTIRLTGCAYCPWNLIMGAFVGDTNGPPILNQTNIFSNPGTNTGGTGPGGPPGGTGGGPGMPPGSGQGSNTNLTGGQFNSGLGALLSIDWQGFQMLDGDLRGISNGIAGLGGLGGTGTNGLGIYSTNTSDGHYSNYGTNAGNGAAQLGAADSDAASLMSNLGTNPVIAAGNNSGLSIAFAGGYTLDLDPESVFPNIPVIIRQLIGWAATIWFLSWFAQEYRVHVTAFAAAELGGVPDMDAEVAGFGGNLIGVASAAVVPIVFIALWVGVFTLGFSVATYELGTGFWPLNPFDTMNTSGGTAGQIALYLLNHLMPISYLLSLVWTRIWLTFAMAKFAAISIASGRFLFGK